MLELKTLLSFSVCVSSPSESKVFSPSLEEVSSGTSSAAGFAT